MLTVRILAGVLLLLAIQATPAAGLTTGSVVHFHDYLTPPNDTNCTSDVSAKLRAAEHDWEAIGGEFDFGAGCYMLLSRVDFGTGKYVFGDIHGAGPTLTLFRTTSNNRVLQFNDYGGGQLYDFSLQGPGPVNGGQAGIVFANLQVDLGTCCISVHDVTSSGFARCWQFGDDSPPYGAAAEMTLTNVSASQCNFGYRMGGWNTLDLNFYRANVTDSNVGWHNCYPVGCAGQLSWHGGGSTKVGTDFQLYADANATIEGYRAECYGTQPRVMGGSGVGGLTIRASQFATCTTPLAASISLSVEQMKMVRLENNTLSGPVVIADGTTGSLYSSQNRIWAPAGKPIVAPVGFRWHSLDDCQLHDNGGNCNAWWPTVP